MAKKGDKDIKGQKEIVIPTERSDEGSQNMDMLLIPLLNLGPMVLQTFVGE